MNRNQSRPRANIILAIEALVLAAVLVVGFAAGRWIMPGEQAEQKGSPCVGHPWGNKGV